jgi:hypothetical protein
MESSFKLEKKEMKKKCFKMTLERRRKTKPSKQKNWT